ncbi:quinone oxidoreductase family protein [Bacillus solimangrovi]|uniref:Quinone oxidoreductase n=1 Tax=Bacillus solimangrovi TaxID=1305675 RepID=A0A1E5LK43_9BACI|nr:zinc-binding dehydrogenase [Bacillus solimangrovi]OEH94445.1 quinone oxidoreductase [Bacillus solimangrovi]
MKSIVVKQFGGPEVLRVTDVEIPNINSDEVLIRVEKTSVNFADIKKRTGKKGLGKFPFTPGLDVAGTIVSVGENVNSLIVGQRVMAFPTNGSYAEYVVAKEILTYEIPDNVDFSIAAACPTVSILSYKLLHDIARLQEGENVLIHAAAGGVGTTAIQLAKLLGANKVIGTVSHEDKYIVVKNAGADHVMLYEDFPKKVNELTDGKGVDVILDSVAGETSELSMQCLAYYGRFIHFGNSSGVIGSFKTNELHASCRSVLGYSLGTTRQKRPADLKKAAKKVLEFISNEQLHIQIGAEFPLEQANLAHSFIESRKSTGKVILSVRD